MWISNLFILYFSLIEWKVNSRASRKIRQTSEATNWSRAESCFSLPAGRELPRYPWRIIDSLSGWKIRKVLQKLPENEQCYFYLIKWFKISHFNIQHWKSKLQKQTEINISFLLSTPKSTTVLSNMIATSHKQLFKLINTK